MGSLGNAYEPGTLRTPEGRRIQSTAGGVLLRHSSILGVLFIVV